MRVEYEWATEQVDKYDDRIDTHFSDQYPGLPEDESTHPGVYPDGEIHHTEVCVVCDLKYDDGYWERGWAYIDGDGKLPEQFTDTYDRPIRKVPKRFQEEIDRAQG